MGLNWNEIKSRALLFSKTWADASNEDSEAKPFWIAFFEIFGITDKRVAIEQPTQCVLDARAQFAGASLADLYDPLTMPSTLHKAHVAVDAAYLPSGGIESYGTDAKRVTFRFDLYQRITSLLPVTAMNKSVIARARNANA